jgi:hypothetical protein
MKFVILNKMKYIKALLIFLAFQNKNYFYLHIEGDEVQNKTKQQI